MTLYERIGGEAAVNRLVDRFYLKVLTDDSLAHFFDTTKMESLKHMQREFFTIALGGPSAYSDINIARAHQGLKIEINHFRSFTRHLIDTLDEFELSEDDVYQIVSDINTYVGDVVEQIESPI